ncbi:hypothetical protein [Desulforamulus aquiferis]|uniref:MotA/TolQ/ExbB proton channel domain-containing protein n=1 Tax=Desulforamulus aquiferis TaxID=1397668 RepID=A0AAW7ZC94_9FIRM|nr:hypothetical protein [Desulforamulus aquiferis]MDO7787145.1 hypothetical protein [Desulforamulus aquiferis]
MINAKLNILANRLKKKESGYIQSIYEIENRYNKYHINKLVKVKLQIQEEIIETKEFNFSHIFASILLTFITLIFTPIFTILISFYGVMISTVTIFASNGISTKEESKLAMENLLDVIPSVMNELLNFFVTYYYLYLAALIIFIVISVCFLHIRRASKIAYLNRLLEVVNYLIDKKSIQS